MKKAWMNKVRRIAAGLMVAMTAVLFGIPVFAQTPLIPNTGDGDNALLFPLMGGLLLLSIILIVVYAVLSAKKKKK